MFSRTILTKYSTGETPWVRKVLHKYHETAEKNGAIVIPLSLLFSSLTD